MKMRQFAFAVALMLVPALASAATIMQFSEVGGFNAPFTFTENGTNTSTSITGSKLMSVTIDPSFCAVAGCGGVATTDTYLLTLNASTTAGTLQQSGSSVTMAASGSFSFIGTGTHAGLNLLTVSFTDLLQGSLGGGNPTLQASQPPDTFSGSSSVFGALAPPRGFSFGFSNLRMVASASTARPSAAAPLTSQARSTTAAPVPEPTTMVLLGSGVAALVARRRKARE